MKSGAASWDQGYGRRVRPERECCACPISMSQPPSAAQSALSRVKRRLWDPQSTGLWQPHPPSCMQSLFSSSRLSALDQSPPHLLQLAVHVLHNEVQGHKVLPTWQENGEEGSGHQPSPAASSSQRGASHPWAPRCPQPARSARCTARRPASQTCCIA